MSGDCQSSFSGFNTSNREDELIKKRKKYNTKRKEKHTTQTHTLTKIVTVIP